MERKIYPSDVSGDELAFVVPYLTLMSEETPQRDYALREVFNGLRYIVRSGARMLPWQQTTKLGLMSQPILFKFLG